VRGRRGTHLQGRAAGAAIAVLLVVTVGCGKQFVRRDAAQPTPAPAREVGVTLKQELETPAPATQTPKQARFEMTIADDNNRHPSGVPVKITGPVDRTYTSDARGIVAGAVPPGIYRFEIPVGCHKDVIVQEGGGAKAGIVEGRTTRGTLLLIWQHRFGPAPPVFTDISGDWPIGKSVEVTYAVEDHCAQERVPGRAIATFAFDRSANIAFAATPSLVAGKDGRARVRVTCTKPGPIRLDMYDKANPTDRIDLLQLALGYETGAPSCGAS
jgi:hypothetical protein